MKHVDLQLGFILKRKSKQLELIILLNSMLNDSSFCNPLFFLKLRLFDTYRKLRKLIKLWVVP